MAAKGDKRVSRNDTVIDPTYENGRAGSVKIYGYPAGGSPTRVLRNFSAPVSAAVSLML